MATVAQRVVTDLITRRWFWLHITSLVVALVFLLWAGRGQWFFFDDWDFLVSRNEWSLLASHNGHLSLAPALITTLLKGVFGLGSYWPYLLVTLAVHLANVHLLWRVMLRVGSHAAIATVLAFTFAVLAAGAENSLWAFQTGFISPLLLGALGFLLADRPVLSTRRSVALAMLTVLALTFASTAIPIVAALVIFIAVRHGARRAAWAALPAVVLYGAWYLLVGRGSTGTASYSATNLIDVAVRVPEYFGHEFVDGLAATIPFPQLAPVLIVILAAWIVFACHRGIRQLTIAHYTVLAAVIFGILIALTRVQLGIESAAAGRYVYVLYFLLAPAAALTITAMIGRSRVVLAIATVALLGIAGYNGGLFAVNANNQAALEQTTRQDVAAALVLASRVDYDPGLQPLPVIAPQLTLGDILDFNAKGQLSPLVPDASALLSTEANLELKAVAESGAPACTPLPGGAEVTLTGKRVLYSSVDQSVNVSADRAGAMTSYVVIRLREGNNVVEGLGTLLLRMSPSSPGTLCTADD